MKRRSTSTQVPSADTEHDAGVQLAPDGRPYSIQPGDRIAPSEGGPGAMTWREREVATGFWVAVGFLPSAWGTWGLYELVSEGVFSFLLVWTFVSAFGLTMAFRSALRARREFGPRQSNYLERSFFGIFRKRW